MSQHRSQQTDFPYTIVREDQWCEDYNGIHIVYTDSYDAKGRVVGVSTQKYRNEVQIGHFAEYVEPDGFWQGGAYDDDIGTGCRTFHPFVEGEVQSRRSSPERQSTANGSLKPYTDSDGNVYESYEAYCNSPDLDDYTVMLKLWVGSRSPQNDHERRLLAELEEIRRVGGIPDFTETP